MRRRFALLSVLLLVAGCAGLSGNVQRERELLPAMRAAWAGIRLDVDRGIDDGVDQGELAPIDSDLLRSEGVRLEVGLSRNRQEAAVVAGVVWPKLHPWALRGIDVQVHNGEIVAGAGESLREAVAQFDSSIVSLRGSR